MAYSKIILNGETLMDVTEDTVDSGNLLSGETATKNSGAKVTGSLSPVTDVTVNGTSVVTSGVAAVTVPDVSGKIDTAGTGLSKSSTTLNHSNSITAQNTQAVYPIKIDAQGHISAYGSSVTVPTITDTYSGTSSNGMSGKAVKSAIDALDGTISGSAGSGKTLTAFSQTNGKVSATFGNISITKSQVSDFPTIPTVNNATLTIQKNGTTVNTFTANSSSNVTANIAVHDVPSGGASGQILTKNSSTDYDASWVSPTETPTASKVSLFDSSAHMNSTDMTSQEVGDFVDGLNVTGLNAVDYIVEQGISSGSNWLYRKWNSGVAECWKRQNSVTYNLTTNYGNGNYYTDDYWSFPNNLFTSVEYVDVHRVNGGVGLVTFSISSVSTSQFNYSVWNNGSSLSSQTYDLTMYAIGKWK